MSTKTVKRYLGHHSAILSDRQRRIASDAQGARACAARVRQRSGVSLGPLVDSRGALFPEAHEPLIGDAWSVDRVRSSIATICTDTEGAFDDGWPTQPLDVEGEAEASPRFRTTYLGGAGVVSALDRLQRRGFVELRRSYLPYLESCSRPGPTSPARTGSAACGWAMSASDSCSSVSRPRRGTSTSSRASSRRTNAMNGAS
jgi:hypothetical protein